MTFKRQEAMPEAPPMDAYESQPMTRKPQKQNAVVTAGKVDVEHIQARMPMPVGLEEMNARKWRILCESIFPSAKTPEAIIMALDYCKVRQLDPFKRPVNIVPMWNKALGKEVETVWPGINSIQVDASRTKEWAGMDAPVWGPDVTKEFGGAKGKYKDDDGVWHDEAPKVSVAFPESCTVTVYRMVEGQRCAFTEIVYWEESYASFGKTGVPNMMWKKRPRGQLHKCAKAAVLRSAFPEAGEYTADEMEGREIESGGVVIENAPTAKQAYGSATAMKAKWKEIMDAINSTGSEEEVTEALKKYGVDLNQMHRIDAQLYDSLMSAATQRKASMSYEAEQAEQAEHFETPHFLQKGA